MIPLNMIGKHNTDEAIISANIEATMWRGYEPMTPGTEKGCISIVGAGPSLSDTYRDIKGDVIALNSAHDFLIEKGVVPKYTMLWDAHPVMEKVLTPHLGVKYLVASRCHESVFKKLVGCDVIVFHAIGDTHLDWILKRYRRPELMLGGGSTSATRAMILAKEMGYGDEMHLFGCDGSYSDKGETHVRGSVVAQEKFRISVCGKSFSVAPWMALQGQDFKTVLPMFRANGIRVVVHGNGLIPYCASFLGCETPDLKVGWMEKYLRRPWHSLIAFYTLLRTSPQLLGGLTHAGI